MKTELTQLQIIKEFAVSLLSQNSLEDLLWDMAANIGKLLDYEDCVIYLNINDVLEQYAAHGIKNPSRREIVERIQIPVGEGIVGTVAATGISELVCSTSDDPRYIKDLYCGKSEIAVPIISEGKVIGVIDSENKEENAYSNDDLEILQAIANIAASRIAAAMSQEEVVRVMDEGDRYKALLENEREWSRTVLESIQDGIIATNDIAQVVMMSPMAGQLIGRLPEEVKGLPLDDVFPISNSVDLASIPLSKLADGEAELNLKNGNRLKISFRVSPLQYDGDLIGRVIVFRDIAREQFLEQEAEKAQRLQSLGVLAGGIAHDFNNNIQSVLSSLHALKIVHKGTGTRMIELAEKACMQSKALARQLLTFSKGGDPLIEATDTEDLLRRSIDLAMAGRASSIRFEVTVPLSNMLVDKIQIEQVFGNIAINADQAMPNGGQVTVRARNSRLPSDPSVDCVEVSIADHGDGIDPSLIGRIFDPYFSTRSTGSGLGLTISYSIVKRHGGEIVVESEPGEGTCFKIYLPATVESIHQPQEPAEAERQKSLKILLLDDDRLVLQTTAAILENFGHQVAAVVSREQAISVFQEHNQSEQPFDLAILDLTIRGDVGGQEVGRQLQQIDPELKMLVASGYSNGPVMRDYRKYGFCGVLEKPFDGRRLSNAVNAVFEP